MTGQQSVLPSSAQQRFEQIDVLRGLAALTVVFSHYLPHWDRYMSDSAVLVPNALGTHAVKLFFIVSGFVIFFTLDRCKSVTDFAVLRFSRLYPAYWASLIVATIGSVALFGKDLWLGGFVINMTMFQEFFGFKNLDNVYWSLTVELAFYFNSAVLLALGLHRRPRRVVFVWLILSAVWGLTLFEPGVKPRSTLALLFALDHSSYFAMGIVFFHSVRHGWSMPSVGLIGLAIAVQGIQLGWSGVMVAAIAALIFLLALRGLLGFTVNRVTLWLGAISYCLYLIHRNLGYQTLDALHDLGVGQLAAISITVVAALAVASALTYWIERPSSKLIRRMYSSRS